VPERLKSGLPAAPETPGRPVPAADAGLTDVVAEAYGVALCLTHGPAPAGPLLQEAATMAGGGAHGGQQDFRLRLLGGLARAARAAERPSPERPEADLEDTPDLLLYARSVAAGWPTAGEHPAADLLDRLGTERVVAALRHLPMDYRIVCALYFMADLSYEEMGRVLEYPVGTVRSRLHRGRKMLQKALWQVAESEGLANRPGGETR
jgi:RNA polymerase sigma-70 factor, ECF subfamily